MTEMEDQTAPLERNVKEEPVNTSADVKMTDSKADVEVR